MLTNELMNAWVENGKAAMEPLRALGEVNKSTLEAVTQQQVALAKEYMDFGARNVKLMTTAREPHALVDDQLTLARDFGDKLVAGAEAYAKLASDYQQALTSWTEKATEDAVKTAGEAVEKAQQATEDAVKTAGDAVEKAHKAMKDAA